MPVAAMEDRHLAACGRPPQETRVRRRISPQAGRALEMLGHAIEYLTDEYVQAGGNFCTRNPQLQAIQIMMAANREIYFACPEVPGLATRLLALLHLGEA